MEQKSILIADADPQTLETFRELLGPDWQLSGAESSTAALGVLKGGSFHVVVANLDLPGSDGPQFLNRVRNKYPRIVRFITAAEADRDRVVKKSLGAHQFLTLPLDRASLRETIERSLALDAMIGNDRLRELISRIRSLPTIPAVYGELQAALRQPDATTEQVGAIIARDMAIMTKLLQVLNSAYFGLARKVTDPVEAVGLMGFETVRSMAMAIKLLSQYDRIKPTQFSIDRLWQHSTSVAQTARMISLSQNGDRAMAETAFTAGLLHDVGKVVLAGNFEEQYLGAFSLARKQQMQLCEVEKEIFGAHHGEIGAYLLGLWGLPLEVVESVALHHHPMSAKADAFGALTAVHIADYLVHEVAPEAEGVSVPALDREYLEKIGVWSKLDLWRQEVFQREGVMVVPTKQESNETPVAAVEVAPTPMPEPAESTAQPVLCEPEPLSVPPGPRWFASPVAWLAAAACVILLGSLAWVMIRPETNPDVVAAKTIPDNGAFPRDARTSQLSLKSKQLVAHSERAPGTAQPTVKIAADAGTASGFDAAASTSTDSLASTAPAWGDTTPAPVTKPATPSAVASNDGAKELKLQGIFFSAEDPSAIINGKLVRNSDRIGAVKIEAIRPDSVVIESQGQRRVLRLK